MIDVKDSRTIVVKIGTSSLVTEHESQLNSLDITTLSRHVADIADLWHARKEVIIVTSGAAGLGTRAQVGDVNIATMRGQYRLMDTYADLFMEHGGIDVGQMLLTKDDFNGRKKRERIVSRINLGFSQENTIIIVNENDAISHPRITFGDNDRLAAELAILLKADVLVFLSREAQTELGKGGPNTKAEAIDLAERHRIVPLVVDGKGAHVIRQLFDGTDGEVLRAAIRDSARIKGRHLKSH